MTAPAVASKGPRPLLIAPNWWIGILPRDLWKRKKSFYIYEADFVGGSLLGAGATVGVEVDTPIQSDSDFLVLGVSALVSTNANPPLIIWGSGMTNNALSNVLIRIRDVGSSRDLLATSPGSNTFPPLDNVCGSGPFPAPLPLPYLFAASSTIATTLFADSSGTTAKQVRVSYWGVRIYKAQE